MSGGNSGSLTVASGQSVYLSPGTTLGGSVPVQSGGALWAPGREDHGAALRQSASAIHLCGSTVSGSLTLTHTSGLVVVGDDGGPTACAGNKITGSASITGGFGGVEFNGNTVSGSLTVTGKPARSHRPTSARST